MNSDPRDRQILRDLAKRIRDIAAHPLQDERRQLWYTINRLQRCRPPVLLSMNDLYWNEVVPEASLVTSSAMARAYERHLRLQIWQWENVDDDCVTEPVVEYALEWNPPRRIPPRKVRTGGDVLGAYQVVPVIEGEEEIDRIIVDRRCSVDRERTARNREWVGSVFGDILRPVQKALWLGCAPFDYLCEIRGMDNVFKDMIDRPVWLEEIMYRLYQLHIDTAKFLEHENVLALNHTYQLGSNGGQGYTDELPSSGFEPGRVRLKDLWGHSTAQAAVSISPEMHERFITQFDREYHELFGLTGVGCCETVDRKMHLLRTLPNLRRISISAWNDFGKAAEEIGSEYVYSLKPSAASISQSDWDVERDMEYLANILNQTRGCHVEIIHREIATCRGKPERLSDWSKAARKLVVEYG